MLKQGNGVSVENVSPTQKPLRRRRPPSLGCVVLSYILLFSSLLALNVYIFSAMVRVEKGAVPFWMYSG